MVPRGHNLSLHSDKAIDTCENRGQAVAIHRDRQRDRPFEAGATEWTARSRLTSNERPPGEARAAGYTERDPRIDPSGEDVRRKLLILARAAGLPLEAHHVQVDSLVPALLAAISMEDLDAQLPLLDAPLRARYQQAYRDGARLRFIGHFDADIHGDCRASVGLRALPTTHPLCSGSGTDNRVAIRSCRYREQPLVIQGPGAGAEVTAAALLDDVLQIGRG